MPISTPTSRPDNSVTSRPKKSASNPQAAAEVNLLAQSTGAEALSQISFVQHLDKNRRNFTDPLRYRMAKLMGEKAIAIIDVASTLHRDIGEIRAQLEELRNELDTMGLKIKIKANPDSPSRPTYELAWTEQKTQAITQSQTTAKPKTEAPKKKYYGDNIPAIRDKEFKTVEALNFVIFAELEEGLVDADGKMSVSNTNLLGRNLATTIVSKELTNPLNHFQILLTDAILETRTAFISDENLAEIKRGVQIIKRDPKPPTIKNPKKPDVLSPNFQIFPTIYLKEFTDLKSLNQAIERALEGLIYRNGLTNFHARQLIENLRTISVPPEMLIAVQRLTIATLRIMASTKGAIITDPDLATIRKGVTST